MIYREARKQDSGSKEAGRRKLGSRIQEARKQDAGSLEAGLRKQEAWKQEAGSNGIDCSQEILPGTLEREHLSGGDSP